MRVAYYAPLKPPDHPVPSGDRTMARLLLTALRRAGHRVEVASRLRALDPGGCAARQARIARRGTATVARLLARYRAVPAAQRPRAWFTYHLYHKSPDWLGPGVSRGLGIPYVVAEASHAEKQRGGPWASGLAQAEAGIRRADALICLNPADSPGLRDLLPAAAHRRLHSLAPFVDVAAQRRRAGLDAPAQRDPDAVPRLLCVGMMREGAKLASYRILAAALARLGGRAWQLDVVGDGPAGEAVRGLLAPLGSERVRHHGQLGTDALAGVMADVDLLVWPAVNEAWGMVFLEAAALGVPAVAGDAGGVRAVIEPGRTGVLAQEGDAGAFAAALESLLSDPAGRRRMARAAWHRAGARHDLDGAARRLDALLREVV